jgi:hypothetical protein
MKNKFISESGAEITVNCYKMYGIPAVKVNSYNAKEIKQDFIESIAEGDTIYKKRKGDKPIGQVIQLKVRNQDNSGFDCYGASVKSYLDKWNRIKGLKVAYQNLFSNYTALNRTLCPLTKEDRKTIAKIIGLVK